MRPPASPPWVSAGLALCLVVAATAASAQGRPTGLVWTEPGHPLAAVPGRTDGAEFSSFSTGRTAYSPDGRQFALIANIGNVATPTTVVLAGTRRGITTVLTQNVPLPGLGLAFDRTPDSIAIADSGRLAFQMTALGQPSNNRVLVARCDATACDSVARQDAVIPGLELSVPGATGEKYGGSMSVSAVLADDRVALTARSTSGVLDTAVDEFLLVADGSSPVQVLAQTGVLVPRDQPGGATDALGAMDRIAAVAPDAAHWLLQGQTLATGFPDVVVVDGRAVLLEGGSVPGLAGTITAPQTRLSPTGQWLARGFSTTSQAYLIVNGSLRLKGGDPIPGAPAAAPVGRIDTAAINARGDVAYTVQSTAGQNFIIVEPVGGAPFVAVSDATRLNVGGSSRGTIFYGGSLSLDLGIGLADDGTLWFMTRARDRQNLNVADGLFRMRVPLATPAP